MSSFLQLNKNLINEIFSFLNVSLLLKVTCLKPKYFKYILPNDFQVLKYLLRIKQTYSKSTKFLNEIYNYNSPCIFDLAYKKFNSSIEFNRLIFIFALYARLRFEELGEKKILINKILNPEIYINLAQNLNKENYIFYEKPDMIIQGTKYENLLKHIKYLSICNKISKSDYLENYKVFLYNLTLGNFSLQSINNYFIKNPNHLISVKNVFYEPDRLEIVKNNFKSLKKISMEICGSKVDDIITQCENLDKIRIHQNVNFECTKNIINIKIFDYAQYNTNTNISETITNLNHFFSIKDLPISPSNFDQIIDFLNENKNLKILSIRLHNFENPKSFFEKFQTLRLDMLEKLLINSDRHNLLTFKIDNLINMFPNLKSYSEKFLGSYNNYIFEIKGVLYIQYHRLRNISLEYITRLIKQDNDIKYLCINSSNKEVLFNLFNFLNNTNEYFVLDKIKEIKLIRNPYSWTNIPLPYIKNLETIEVFDIKDLKLFFNNKHVKRVRIHRCKNEDFKFLLNFINIIEIEFRFENSSDDINRFLIKNLHNFSNLTIVKGCRGEGEKWNKLQNKVLFI